MEDVYGGLFFVVPQFLREDFEHCLNFEPLFAGNQETICGKLRQKFSILFETKFVNKTKPSNFGVNIRASY